MLLPGRAPVWPIRGDAGFCGGGGGGTCAALSCPAAFCGGNDKFGAPAGSEGGGEGGDITGAWIM
ncbi:MAG TPA: hypothetical protein VK832_22555, partial [Burkholderiaceae bacterium]|nr:hypothetical protein [Burkholderiaceae bacterium]